VELNKDAAVFFSNELDGMIRVRVLVENIALAPGGGKLE